MNPNRSLPTTTTNDILTSFEQTSVRCLTRQEQCVLQTAAAMVIVKERFRNQQNKKKRRPMDPWGGRTCRLDAIFSLREQRSIPRTLLEQPHQDHMDHLFQVACRLAAQEDNNNNETNRRALDGVACHLVQQLDAWIDHLLLLHNDNNIVRDHEEGEQGQDDVMIHHRPAKAQRAGAGSSKGPAIAGSEEPVATATATAATASFDILIAWIQGTLLSNPHAAWVHRAMVLHALDHTRTLTKGLRTSRTVMLDGWWLVASSLLEQVYHGTLAFPAPRTIANISGDALAVNLLDLMDTLAGVSDSIIIPECLEELLFPLPTPASLVSLLQRTTTLTGVGNSVASMDSFLLLSPGAKLLIRLGLYRILLLHPSQTNDNMAGGGDDDEHYSWQERAFY